LISKVNVSPTIAEEYLTTCNFRVVSCVLEIIENVVSWELTQRAVETVCDGLVMRICESVEPMSGIG